MSEIIAIRKKGGIDHIAYDKGQQRIQPEIYYQKYKDPDADGIPQGAYREGMILDSKHFFAPIWNNNSWPWGDSVEKLASLIKRMRLKYEKGNPKEGQVIEPGNVKERLKDFYDPVFRHSSFYGKYYMQDSRGTFDQEDPRQQFMYLMLKGSTLTENPGSSKIISKYEVGTKYKLISPKKESKEKVKSTLKEIDAKKFVGQLYGEEEKIRAICVAMEMPSYRPRIDIESAWLLLDEASQNTTNSAKYGKTVQDMFLQCCKMPNEELEVYQKIIQGKTKGFLRKWHDYYTFDGEKIHVKNNTQLVKYMREPKHQEQLLKLIDLVESADKQ